MLSILKLEQPPWPETLDYDRGSREGYPIYQLLRSICESCWKEASLRPTMANIQERLESYPQYQSVPGPMTDGPSTGNSLQSFLSHFTANQLPPATCKCSRRRRQRNTRLDRLESLGSILVALGVRDCVLMTSQRL